MYITFSVTTIKWINNIDNTQYIQGFSKGWQCVLTTLCMCLPYTKHHFFGIHSEVRRVYHLVIVVLRSRWVWSLTGETRNTRRKIYSSSGLSTTNLTWISRSWTSASAPRGWQLNTSVMESPLKTDVYLNYVVEIQLYITAFVSIRQTSQLKLYMEIISKDHEQLEKHINTPRDKMLNFVTLQWVMHVIKMDLYF